MLASGGETDELRTPYEKGVPLGQADRLDRPQGLSSPVRF